MRLHWQIVFTRVAWPVSAVSQVMWGMYWMYPLLLSLPVTLQWHNKCTLCLAAESFKSDIFTSEPVPGVSIFSFGHWNVLIFLQILFSYHFQISSLCHFIQIENHNSRNIPRTISSIKFIYFDIIWYKIHLFTSHCPSFSNHQTLSYYLFNVKQRCKFWFATTTLSRARSKNINMMNNIPTVTANNDRSFVAKSEPFTCRRSRANLELGSDMLLGEIFSSILC